MTKRIIIINNIKEYELLVKEGYNFTGLTIATTNIDLYYKYKDYIEIINLWKYLNDKIIETGEEYSLKIHNDLNLYDENSINYYDVDIFNTTKISLKPFFTATYNSNRAFEKLVKEYEISEVNINAEISIPMQVFFDDNHILSAIAIDFFCKRGVSIKRYQLSVNNLKSNLKNYNFDVSQYLFSLEKFIEKKNIGRIMILLSENFEWDFELSKYLQKKYNNVIVALRTQERKPITRNTKNLPLFFDDFNFNTEDLIADFKKIEVSKKHFIETKSRRLKQYPEVFSNKYLDYQIIQFFEKQKVYIRDLHTFDKLYNFIKPSKIYFSNSWDYGVRCMTQRAMDLGSNTFVTIHGGVIDNSGYKTRVLQATNYFVWGPDNFYGLKEAGQKEESIKITGSMQMEYWNLKAKEYNKSGFLAEKTEYDNMYNLNIVKENRQDKQVVTFFTSAGGGFASHTIKENEHIESLKKIIELANKCKEIEFRIKPHILFDYYSFWNDVKKSLPANLVILKENNLMQACDEMTLGVLLNTQSNVAYEISLMGKPLIYLKDAVFNVKCGESTIERGGILCLHSFEEFNMYLVKFFGLKGTNYKPEDTMPGINTEGIKLELEKRRVDFLEYSLADFSTTVIERIEELIMKDVSNYRNKDESELDICKVIEWVSDYIKSDNLKEFPEIIDINKLPNGQDFINWIYILSENWCRYFKKEKELVNYFEELVKKLPQATGVNSKMKFKRKIYAKTRAMYLKYNLNENENVRKIVKRIF